MNKLLFPVILAAVFLSCSILEGPKDISNPMDPNDPNFVPPAVTFIQGPINAETVDTCAVTFEWEGNQPGMDFSYRMDNREWSEWSNYHSVEYPLLDEGNHRFEIKARYFNGVENDTSQSLNFSVKDLTGPALTLYPRYSAGKISETVDVEIAVREVIDLALIKAVLRYNPSLLVVNSVTVYEAESFLAIQGGTVIPFYYVNNQTGTITIDVGVATGTPNSVSGSGPIARIRFLRNSSLSSELNFDVSSEFRGPDNTTIQINDFGNGQVHVE